MNLGNTNQKELDPVPAEFIQTIREFVGSWCGALASRRRPNGPLYHYCDANALLSIFRTRSLWATGTRYLNDRSELVALLRNLPELTKKHTGTSAGKAAVELSRVIQSWGDDILANAIGAEICIACFSEDGDVLSQWRAYADDGHGFAIGFDTTQLRVLAGSGSGDGELKRISYGGTDEQELIDNLFQGFAERIEPYLDSLDTSGWNWEHGCQTARSWLSFRMSECLGELTCECKHASFAEEREWRIIAPRTDMQFRVSNHRIVPFRQLDMSSTTNEALMPISRIVVGPKADWASAERVLMYIADHYGYGHCGFDLAQSKAPYR